MITLPGPLAASDITHYVSQIVREFNAEIAAIADQMAKIGDLRSRLGGLEGRMGAVEGRMGALEVQVRGLAGRVDKIEAAAAPAPTAKEVAAAAKVEAKNG